MRPAGIVLAGGASRRFGGDKLAADLDGRSVLAHAVGGVTGVASPVVVVLAPEAAVPDLGPAVLVARDTEAFGGPLAGLLVGLEALVALPGGAPDTAILVGGDMPSLVPGVLALMADALARDPALGAVTLGIEPPTALPMAVRVALALPAVRSLLAADRRRLRGPLDLIPSAVIAAAEWRALDPDAATLRDIDTRSDLGPSPT
ncbi:MAG: molybdenum cofactor guanylyltransferase [Chloroflexota bacterium]